MTNAPAGLYLHIPFCEKKCRYCDFYSSFVTEELLDSYTDVLKKAIKQWGGKFNRPIDTIYLGGGTPSLLSHRLPDLIEEVKKHLKILPDCEITLELNPTGRVEEILNHAAKAGVNRLSIGAQSGDDAELKRLGRTHTVEQTVKTVALARKIGFENISLDIMLGLPNSNCGSLRKSLCFLKELAPEHISAYILKIEENTAFFAQKEDLNLPDDEQAAEQYLYMCEFFEQLGYSHYEISNFCRQGKESRHNLKYWQGVDYLGIGPSAHSSAFGERFYYNRDLKAFLKGSSPVAEGKSGGKEEFIMLRLRLKDGIDLNEYQKEFGALPNKAFIDKCRMLCKAGLMKMSENNVFLTNKGMLLSNSIIAELLEWVE